MKDNKRNRILIYSLAFIIPLFMTGVFFALCHIYPFGDESLLVWDMNRQYISFYSYLKTVFCGKNDIFYTFSKTLGGDMPGFAAYYLHDPVLLILLLFPAESIAVGIEAVFALHLALAGLSCSVLLTRRYGYDPAVLIFSTAYSFCSYVFAYIANQAYFPVIILLPLVICLYLEVIEKQRLKAVFTLLLFFTVWTNYYQAYMVIIFLVIIFLSRLIADLKYIRAVRDVVICILEAVMLDCFSLIPTVIALRGQKSTTEADFAFYRKFSLLRLPAALYTGALRNDRLPQIYCSLIVMTAVIAFFLIQGISIREKAAGLFVIAALTASMCINTIDAVWHGFNNPVGCPWRYSYMLSLTFVVLGYVSYMRMKKELPVFIAGAVFAAGCVILAIDGSPYIDRERLIINTAGIIIITALLAVLLAFRKKHGRLILGFLILISFTDMIYNSEVVFTELNARLSGDERTRIPNFERSIREIDEAVSRVKDTDSGFFRTEKTFEYSMNDPMMFDMPGLSHSSSCETIDIRHFMQRMGFRDTGLYAYYAGGSTAFADSLLGVKYLISQWDSLEKGYTHVDATDKYHIFRNENAMPIAYLTDPSVAQTDPGDGNTFEFQNAIARTVIDRDIFIKAASDTVKSENAVSDGNDVYRRTGDEDAFLSYDIDITENHPLYMYFDAPFTGYAEVFVNGASWGDYFTETHWNVICAGTYKKGDRVQVRLKLKGDELAVDEACFYYEDMDALKEWHDILEERNSGTGRITRLSSSHLKLEVFSKEDDMLFIGMPYDRGWKITVDGQEAEAEKVLGVLTGVRLTPGEHSIEMRYIPRGLILGLLICVAGTALMIITNKKAVPHK